MAKKRKKKNKKKPWERSRRGGQSWRYSSSKKKKDDKKKSKKKSWEPPKKKKKKSSSGSSKKVRKAAKRITSSLQVQRDQGNARAQQIRNMQIERTPKNIGNTSGRSERNAAQSRINSIQKRNAYGVSAVGIPGGLDAAGVKVALQGGSSWGPNDQKRYDEYMRKKGIDGLKNDALVNPDRFGPLAAQYTQGMDALGANAQGYAASLNNQRDQLQAQGQSEKQLYLDEIARNHASMQMLQQANQQQTAAMQASMDADRAARAQELYVQQQMLQEQQKQAAAAAAIQAEQQRKATNLANAYVPEQVESLGSVSYGDARTDSTATKKRKAKNNTISSLRMNTGLSKPSPLLLDCSSPDGQENSSYSLPEPSTVPVALSTARH